MIIIQYKSFIKTIAGNLRGSIFALIISFFALINSFGQDITYKYLVGTTAPDPNWKEVNFNDSSWLVGTGSIGYGDGDDSIITDTTPSVYIRYKLTAKKWDLTNLKALLLYADFDDGYIAYLNGKKVLSVNMNDTLTNLTNLTTTIRSHEAELYRNVFRPTQGFYIAANLLDSCNFDTTNILAFEVHNDSINGSDLSFSFKYQFYNDNFYYNYFTYDSRFIQQVPLDSIDIPIIIIETDEYGFNFDTGRTAKMGIINNKFGKYNKLSDAYTDYNGRISLKGRGNRSRDYPKVSFRIELQDSAGNNNNVSIFGMPKENDFILYGPYSDESLIRDEIAFTFGRWLGYYEPRTRFCELIVNGRDVGLYVFTETIKPNKNRVNITKLTSNDNSGVELTGGYIFGYDSGWEPKIFYPSSDNITQEQKDYINGYVKKLDSIIYDKNFMDPYTGYRKYIDIESLADFIIVNEAVYNREAYIQSTYMVKDRDDRNALIKYGPLWDFDNSLGYALYTDIPVKGWRFADPEVTTLQLMRIFQDTGFCHLFARRWHNYRQYAISNDAIFNFINKLVDTLRPAIDRNYEIWPIKGLADYGYHPQNKGKTYDEEITKLNNWLSAHLTWIDENIDKLYVPLVNNKFIKDLNGKTNFAFCYPNPFKDHITLAVALKSSGSIKFEVYDIVGKKLKEVEYSNLCTGENHFRIDMSDIREAGMYIVNVTKDNLPVVSQRVVKIK